MTKRRLFFVMFILAILLCQWGVKFFFALVNLTEDSVAEMLKTMQRISKFEFTKVKSKSKHSKFVFHKSNFKIYEVSISSLGY